MPISLSKPLTVQEIAQFWSNELRGEPWEESYENIAVKMLAAFITRELKSPMYPMYRIDRAIWNIDLIAFGRYRHDMDGSGYDADVLPALVTLYPDACESGLREAMQAPSDSGLALEFRVLLEVKITRDEFLRWVDAQGYQPRPTFWDCKEMPAAQATADPTPADAGRPELDAFINEWIASGRHLLAGRISQQFCDAARDHCGGWENKKEGRPALLFSDKTIKRYVKDFLPRIGHQHRSV